LYYDSNDYLRKKSLLKSVYYGVKIAVSRQKTKKVFS